MFTSKAGMMEATIVKHPIVPQAEVELLGPFYNTYLP
jgi:hypothetical protein